VIAAATPTARSSVVAASSPRIAAVDNGRTTEFSRPPGPPGALRLFPDWHGHREESLGQHAHRDVPMPPNPLTDLVGIHPELVLTSLVILLNFQRTPAVRTPAASGVPTGAWTRKNSMS
jgi:hypothetical protein